MSVDQIIDIFLLLPSMEGGEGEKSSKERRSGSRAAGVMAPFHQLESLWELGASGPVAGGSEGVTCSVHETYQSHSEYSTQINQERLSFSLTGSVESLVRQHQRFCRFTQEQTAVARYLEQAGHFEFGPQRVPSIVDKDNGLLMKKAFENNENHIGYAYQWSSIYEYVHQLKTELALYPEHIKIVKYEDFCLRPIHVFEEILDFCGLPRTDVSNLEKEVQVSPYQHKESQAFDSYSHIVKNTAEFFNYQF